MSWPCFSLVSARSISAGRSHERYSLLGFLADNYRRSARPTLFGRVVSGVVKFGGRAMRSTGPKFWSLYGDSVIPKNLRVTACTGDRADHCRRWILPLGFWNSRTGTQSPLTAGHRGKGLAVRDCSGCRKPTRRHGTHHDQQTIALILIALGMAGAPVRRVRDHVLA